jgi:dihydropteroate synthase
MGVVNVTPDSFSDGGRFLDPAAAVAHARRLAEEGADILDIGGESTRPGAAPVSEEEELRRVIPVLEKIGDLCVSVDTRRPRVMREALQAGASMINDVDALSAPGALEAVAGSDCAACLMHKKGEPATMQHDPHYDDVVSEVKGFLDRRTDTAMAAGIAAERIVVDPGFGFGKTAAHNLVLLKHLRALSEFPLLVGLSRKSTRKYHGAAGRGAPCRQPRRRPARAAGRRRHTARARCTRNEGRRRGLAGVQERNVGTSRL